MTNTQGLRSQALLVGTQASGLRSSGARHFSRTQEPGTSHGNTGIRAALAPSAAVEGPLVLLAIPFRQKLVITFHYIASAFSRPQLIHKFTSLLFQSCRPVYLTRHQHLIPLREPQTFRLDSAPFSHIYLFLCFS